MTRDDRSAGFLLLDKGTLVEIRTLDISVAEGVDDAEFGVRITLRLGENDDDNDVEWGGLGFMFTLALLSFADARARGYSENEYQENDQLLVADFLQELTYVNGCLQFYGDYIRGRRMKTHITLHPDGIVKIETVGRGKAALRWLDRMKGKKALELVRST
jgi:hypothetical protein